MVRRALDGGQRRCDVVFYVPAVGLLLSLDNPRPAGGAETQCLAIATALAERGYRVGLIAYGPQRSLPAHHSGIRVVARPPYRKRGRFVGKLTELVCIWWALWRAPADAIVTRCAGEQVGLVALYARATGRRMVFSTASDVDFDSARVLHRRRERFLYRLGVRLCSAIIVQTNEQRHLCLQTFGRDSVAINSVATPAEAQITEPEAFLWVGRITTYKRPLDYVKLAKRLPTARFWMIAVPGPSSPANDALADQLAVAAADVPNLEILPPRTHAELGNLLDRAVAAVNTSDFEGMPNVLLEGWARGVPALALHHDPGGVITRHQLGAFAHHSADAFVELADMFWLKRRERHDISSRCRAYVDREHSAAAVSRRWEVVLGLPPGRGRGRRRPSRDPGTHEDKRAARAIE
jgi:glycosyltransferase involved in cell wall biosynthesis